MFELLIITLWNGIREMLCDQSMKFHSLREHSCLLFFVICFFLMVFMATFC